MGLLDGISGAMGGILSSPEGKEQIMKFVSSPEGMAMIQKFIEYLRSTNIKGVRQKDVNP